MTRTEILSGYTFYRNADPVFRREIENASVAVKLPPGAEYFHEGGQCRQVALIGKGSVRVYKKGETGREITLYYVLPGETCILSASCMLGEKTYPANAVVEEETVAVVLDAGFFRNAVSSREDMRKFVFETLSRRMTDVLTFLEEITFGRMDMRLAEFLTGRFGEEEGNSGILRMTHVQIAAELGTAREVVSRLLKELERSGAIELSRGRITLLDRDKLTF
jgi:CRP/FNR family transcriptional regulator, anaerobic regulatory protein